MIYYPTIVSLAICLEDFVIVLAMTCLAGVSCHEVFDSIQLLILYTVSLPSHNLSGDGSFQREVWLITTGSVVYRA